MHPRITLNLLNGRGWPWAPVLPEFWDHRHVTLSFCLAEWRSNPDLSSIMNPKPSSIVCKSSRSAQGLKKEKLKGRLRGQAQGTKPVWRKAELDLASGSDKDNRDPRPLESWGGGKGIIWASLWRPQGKLLTLLSSLQSFTSNTLRVIHSEFGIKI